MKSGVMWVGVLAAMVTAATVSSAQTTGYTPGRGGIGGQLGGGKIVAADDYSEGAGARFSFSGHWRYAMTPRWRWQISPGFVWSGYDEIPAPFSVPTAKDSLSKKEYLTLLLPLSFQVQYTRLNAKKGWLYYLGAGPGVYRIWVENERKVIEDPLTHVRHRGFYPGASFQLGAEKFMKSLPSTSVEVSLDGHYAFATRDDQFPAGWSSDLAAVGLRLGVNYYFIPNQPKKNELPGTTPAKH